MNQQINRIVRKKANFYNLLFKFKFYSFIRKFTSIIYLFYEQKLNQIMCRKR